MQAERSFSGNLKGEISHEYTHFQSTFCADRCSEAHTHLSRLRLAGNQLRAAQHRQADMYLQLFLSAALLPGLFCGSLPAQSAPPAQQGAPASTVASMLQPAALETGRALSALNIRHWKTSGDVRDAMLGNATSIQNDLDGTLPDLVRKADAAPGSVPEAFAVYRNLDALYDVLLRVTENAVMAAPHEEASGLQSALDSLKQVRSNLGDLIVNQSKGQQAQIVQLKTTIANAAVAAPAHSAAKTTVVTDGPPATTTTVHKRKKPAANTPAASGAAASSSSGSSSSGSTAGQTQQPH
jgi:hypothetical protein